MKRLFQIIVVVALLLILFFEYRSYQRHRASDAYSYAIDSTIDWEYRDPAVVKEYLMSAEETGEYGRYAWAKHGVDVLTDSPTDPESAEFIQKYQAMLAATRHYELLLKQPGHHSSDGTNLEHETASHDAGLAIDDLLNNPVLARPSDRSALVYEIQKKLKSMGTDLPVDGIYRVETENAVRQFQQSADLYPSGVVDRLTLHRLFQ